MSASNAVDKGGTSWRKTMSSRKARRLRRQIKQAIVERLEEGETFDRAAYKRTCKKVRKKGSILQQRPEGQR